MEGSLCLVTKKHAKMGYFANLRQGLLLLLFLLFIIIFIISVILIIFIIFLLFLFLFPLHLPPVSLLPLPRVADKPGTCRRNGGGNNCKKRYGFIVFVGVIIWGMFPHVILVNNVLFYLMIVLLLLLIYNIIIIILI